MALLSSPRVCKLHRLHVQAASEKFGWKPPPSSWAQLSSTSGLINPITRQLRGEHGLGGWVRGRDTEGICVTLVNCVYRQCGVGRQASVPTLMPLF